MGCAEPTESETVATAQRALAKRDFAAAVVPLKSLLDRQPDATLARLWLGRALLAQGDAAAAEAALERALEGGQSADGVVPELARARVQQRKAGAVIALATNERLADADAHAAFALTLAQAHQSLGQIDAARAAVADGLRSRPEDPELLALDVRLQAVGGNTEQAIQRAKALAQRFADHPAVQLLQADALAAAGDPAADAGYRRALEIDPRLEAAHAALIGSALRVRDFTLARQRVEAMKKALPALLMTTYYDALVAYLGGDQARAQERAQQLLKHAGDNAPANMLAGMVQKRLGSLTRADTLLTKALTAMPGNAELRRESADLQLSLGQPRQALQRLAPLLAPPARDGAAWALAARAHAMLDEPGFTDAALARARALQPDNAQWRLEQARTLMARGQLDAGVRELQSASTVPGGAAALLELVPVLLGRQDIAGALAAADKAAQALPDAPLPEVLRGQALQQRGDRAAARQAFEAALRKQPAFLLAADRLVALDLEEGQPDAAQRRLADFAKRNPLSAPAVLSQAELARRQGQPREAVLRLVDQAVALQPQDSAVWLGAIELDRRVGGDAALMQRAQRAHAALPDDADLAQQLALALRGSGELNQALAVTNKVLSVQPNHLGLRLLAAEILASKGDLPAAGKALDRAAALASGSYEVERAQVRLLWLQGHRDAALALAEQRRKRLPKDLHSLMLVADVRSSLGPSAQSVAVLRSALALSGASFVANRLADELRQVGPAEAAAAFEREWLRTHPRDDVFIAHQAQAAARRGDISQAQALYRQVIELQPQAALAINNLAALLLPAQAEEALVLARRANQLMPASPALMDTLAQALAARGQQAEALRVQTRALELDPQSAALRLTLARLHVGAGNRSTARQLLTSLAERGREGPEVEEARRLLDKLGR